VLPNINFFGLELGGPWHSGAHGHCPPCPPYCYATEQMSSCTDSVAEWLRSDSSSMQPRLSFYGVRWVDEWIRSRRPRFALGLILLVLHRRSVTWGSTWTLTSPWQLMSLKLCQAALQLLDRSAVSNALSLDLCCCRLCSRLSWHVLTMAMQHWLVWVDGWRRDFSLFCTPLLGWSTPNGSTST